MLAVHVVVETLTITYIAAYSIAIDSMLDITTLSKLV